jgi:serine-type D-Ala-D-Ala carboxypeptidase (penicillin-binding protein 5/6)
MLTRRLALFASMVLTVPAWAQLRRPGPAAKPAAPHGARQPKQDVPTGTPADTPLGPVDTTARWGVIIDYTTLATLLNKDADVEMPPSSMTKLMTIYIVYERLASGRMKLTDQLLVSEKAWRMGGSKMFVQIGSQVSVEDLIRGIIVDSGNDACIVLAEAISGSEEQFAELMNQKAKELGLTHSHFLNATGWPADGHYMSCRDIAMLAWHIIHDFPQYYHFDSEKKFTYNNITQDNRNPLVQRGTADGLKTGHTDAGGYGVVASTLRGDRRLVLVLNGMATMRERAEEGERLMDWAFANFENVTLYSASDVIEHAPVYLGTSPSVPLVAGKDLVMTMPHGWRQSLQAKLSYQSPVPAPVRKGTVVGKLTVAGQGVPNGEWPLQTGDDVPRLSLPGRAMAVLTHMVLGGRG